MARGVTCSIFISAKDPINFVGYVANNMLKGDTKIIYPDNLPEGITIIDVRSPDEFTCGAAPGAKNIPLPELRNRLDEIPKDKEIAVMCKSGIRSYNSEQILKQKGFKVSNIAGGYITWLLFHSEAGSVLKEETCWHATEDSGCSEPKISESANFADLADKYGNGEIIFTQRQNIELRSVPEEKSDELISELKKAGYRLEGLEHIPDIVACVGTTVCNLAVSDTPASYHQLIEKLGKDEEFWKAVGPVRINMNGCPNSCGHHWIADVGLRGCRLKLQEGGSEEGFTVHVGGALDGTGSIGQPVCKVSAHDLPDTLRCLFQLYLDERNDKEIFEEYVKRVKPELIKEKLEKLLDKKSAVTLLNLSLTETFENILKEARKC